MTHSWAFINKLEVPMKERLPKSFKVRNNNDCTFCELKLSVLVNKSKKERKIKEAGRRLGFELKIK